MYAKEVFGKMTYPGKGKLLLLISTILLSSCSYWHTPTLKYLIPEGYEGIIVISWDKKDGEPEVKEGEKYFSYDSVKDSRVELEMIDPGTNVDTASITKQQP